MSRAEPPASLVKYEAALLVSGGVAEQVPTGQQAGKTQTEEILNSILPPREWNQARAPSGAPSHRWPHLRA